MRRLPLAAGGVLLLAAWALAAARLGMLGHMGAHMLSVAVAAPLLAWGIAGSRLDPARRWPGVVTPMTMSLVELLLVWGWHLPAARAFAAETLAGGVLEQLAFVAAGLLLWSAALGTRGAAALPRRAAGVVALLLTSMHMTLLGALVGLAPRVLYGTEGFITTPLADQQLGGVVMLLVGAGSYLVGGLALLGDVLRQRSTEARPA
uniref:Cytochrome c oxidase assembly protein n=1 Tax=Coralloluteibacterium stylophorae TaxID=1776034 RepID=A0A8J7VUN4_9GAMM